MKTIRNKKGVIILEYVLLLVACVAFASLINQIVRIGTPGDSGWVIELWWQVLQMIAEDM